MRCSWLGVVALAGCLSTPDPAASVDAGVDAAVACSTGARPGGTTWLPTDGAVRLAKVADIDADGQDDLIVAVAPDRQDQTGPSKIYVAYGPVSWTAPVFHAELDVDATAQIMAWGISLDDLDGDGCLDLTVAGPPTMGNQNPQVAVWRHQRSGQPWSGAPARSTLSWMPTAEASPIMPLWADLTTNANRDLVVAQLENIDLFVGPSPSLASLPGALAVPKPAPGACGSWGNLNAVVAQPMAGGRERLVAYGHYRHNTVEVVNDVPTPTDNCTDDNAAPITYGVTALDLDGQAPDDLISGGGGSIGLHLLHGSAPPVSPSLGGRACGETPRGASDTIEGLAAGELGGVAGTGVEVVLIDQDDGSPGPAGGYACLLTVTRADDSGLMVNSANELPLTGGGVVRAVTIGRLDTSGRARVWILDADGALRCLQRAEGAAVLEVCS